jgi:hypothetical protein
MILNTSHRFSSDAYEPAKKVSGLCSKLEATLFVLAESGTARPGGGAHPGRA